MSYTNPVLYPLQLAIGALSAPWAELLKGDNSAFRMQQCSLNAILPKNSAGLGYSIACGKMEWFNKTFLIATPTNPYPYLQLSSTYQITFSQAAKWDSRTFLWAGHLIILCKCAVHCKELLLLPRWKCKLTLT